MAKIVDITDKLSFNENPRLEVKGQQYEVNADAKTMLEIMGAFGGKSEMDAALFAYERLFSEGDREQLNKLPFRDLMVVIASAMQLVQGGEDDAARERGPVLRPV